MGEKISRTSSGKDLLKQLGQATPRLLCSLVHKFGRKGPKQSEAEFEQLTGFDAPPCTYLYIDKTMQDHGLFQAICRTNRLDGEDKDFGYIVDYKSLLRKVEKAIAVYTSELDHSSGGANHEVLLHDRLTKGKGGRTTGVGSRPASRSSSTRSTAC